MEQYWISPSGEVIPAPEGHISYIRSHPQEIGLPENVSSGDLMEKGWIRISGKYVLVDSVNTQEAFDSLKDLMVQMGIDRYVVFIDGKPLEISLDEITSMLPNGGSEIVLPG